MIWRKSTLDGYTCVFEFVDDLHAPDDAECKLDGCMVPDVRRILLDSSLRDDQERLHDVLVHECVHAVLWHEGREDEDEGLVDDLGKGLAQLLRPVLKKPRFSK